MPPVYRILAVNPGSTSTKIALFDDEATVADETLHHDAAMIARFSGIWEQLPFRMHAVREWTLARTDHASAVVGMGGLLRPLPGGTYKENTPRTLPARSLNSSPGSFSAPATSPTRYRWMSLSPSRGIPDIL
jgi:butyrate kinase